MFSAIVNKYYEIFYLNADVRTRDKFLMGSPIGVVLICAIYLIMTMNFLEYAKNNPKKRIDFRKSMLTVNLFYLVVSLYIIYKILKYMIWSHYDFHCMPLDTSIKPEVIEIINTQYGYLLLKFAYFLETIIFTLSGKFKLVTPYIVFHHSTMPLLLWWFTNFMPAGHSLFFGLMNLSAHVIFMIYFSTTAVYPNLRPSWGGKFITWVHVIQFTLIIAHWSQLAYNNYCGYPTQMLYIGLGWGLSIVLLYCRAWWVLKPVKE